MRATAVTLAIALASPVGASEGGSPGDVVRAFYSTYLAGGRPSGVPDAARLQQLTPFLTKRFLKLLHGALEYREQWITAHPPEPGPDGVPIVLKPPFVDGALFSSLFEGPTGFRIGRVVKAGQAYRVELKCHYDAPGQPAFRWTDVLVVVKEDNRFVVDDVELLGDWPFASRGRVSEMLMRRE